MIVAGFAQTHPRFGEVSSNLDRVEQQLAHAPRFDVLVLPELFASGYLFRDREEVLQLAEDENGPTLRKLSQWAHERRAWIAAGFPERRFDRVYNSAALVGPDASVRIYRKIHLFDRETLLFDPGDRPFEVWKVEMPAGEVRVGVMICFDWIFPESARCLALEGAEVILHPSNLVLPHCQEAMRTRCLENRVFAVTANRIARDDRGELKLEFTGRSQITDPEGRVLVRSSQTGESIEVRELDLARARNKWITERNQILADRRPLYYKPMD